MKLAQKLAINYIRARLNFTALVSKRKAARMAFDIFCTPFRRSARKDAPIFSSAERRFLEVDGNKVMVYRWNAGGSKKVMVLHGFESSANNFDRYITKLIRKGYEVIAADAPAHGASGGKRINLPLYIKTIAAVYEAMGGIDSYMAHSFGGIAVMHFLENTPHDAGIHVALIAPATQTVTAIDSLFRILQLDNAVRVEFDKLILEKGGVPASHYSIPRTLAHVSATILWVHDVDDDITPIADLQSLIDTPPANVEFVITKGLGHRKIYRDNNVVRKVIGFL